MGFHATVLIKLPLLATAVLAIPAPAEEASAFNLMARSGNHEANVYTGNFCSGNSVGSTVNFGCGGVCHTANQDIWSILLNQDGTGNPKPTADLFSGSNCDGNKVSHAGIFSGEHSGCTNLNSPARSYYLYFNC
ncbi:hypothetical protein QBC47DRAFT_415421 [Echria macrotheca]|uniref:Secreted protein n=1 Tax=Echria macrotheca TaxID=438768 RepID=A0AAJ0BD44_9PEZI|nr:hypothetical protein QBC47DRAFT_415421 [Echria macrotheca]